MLPLKSSAPGRRLAPVAPVSGAELQLSLSGSLGSGLSLGGSLSGSLGSDFADGDFTF